MDWPSSSDPFVHPEDFDCDLEKKYDFESCKVLQYYSTVVGQKLQKDLITLDREKDWEEWFKTPLFVNKYTGQGLCPRNGFSILFIPRAADINFPVGSSVKADYTDVPIPEKYWNKVVTAFQLPRHFVKTSIRQLTSIISISRTHQGDKLWMHTAVANPEYTDAFALAATHSETTSLTLAVMIGCTNWQVDMIATLVEGWEEAIAHPLLMLGLCAELQLDRLDSMVHKQTRTNDSLTDKLEHETTNRGHSGFSWQLMKEVRSIREESKIVEAEVDTTRDQLSKAVQQSADIILGMLNGTKSTDAASLSHSRNDPDQPGVSRGIKNTIPNEKIEITNLFLERFNDVLTRLDRLGAQCRSNVDGISFMTEIVRSLEANTTVDNAKYGIAISFVAMVYLPVTALATIFAMPIFQWSNDWKDWRYHQVPSGNSSASNSDASGNDDSPVLSGYIWIYVGMAIGLTGITFASFFWYTSKKIHAKPPEPQAQPKNDSQTSLTNRLGLIHHTVIQEPPEKSRRLAARRIGKLFRPKSRSHSAQDTNYVVNKIDPKGDDYDNVADNSRGTSRTNSGVIIHSTTGSASPTRTQKVAAPRSPRSATNTTGQQSPSSRLSRRNTSWEHDSTKHNQLQTIRPSRSFGNPTTPQTSRPTRMSSPNPQLDYSSYV